MYDKRLPKVCIPGLLILYSHRVMLAADARSPSRTRLYSLFPRVPLTLGQYFTCRHTAFPDVRIHQIPLSHTSSTKQNWALLVQATNQMPNWLPHQCGPLQKPSKLMACSRYIHTMPIIPVQKIACNTHPTEVHAQEAHALPVTSTSCKALPQLYMARY